MVGGGSMKHEECTKIIDEIHKNKSFYPSHVECKFLEDLSFYASIGSIQISDKQSKILERIYKRSQGGKYESTT